MVGTCLALSKYPIFNTLKEREGKRAGETEALKVRKKISMISNAFANNSTHWLKYNVINGMEKWNVCTTCNHHQQSWVNPSQSVYVIHSHNHNHKQKGRLNQRRTKKRIYSFFSDTRIYSTQEFSMIASIQYQPWHRSGYNLWQFITCERDKKSIHTMKWLTRVRLVDLFETLFPVWLRAHSIDE